ncbi:hypothetical protein FHW69_000633 [Luteibacter sp. Sphag1AF]|uniref:YcxB family protein n=1 Tax=Luteibacter sp. Sphag1AF TaxID=2587031 RepID=UPI0016160580|nr:YcxB family protein [Luteibacter sp. Sphag1AF]MBB3226043.1 hypothetical protein [Luteibacter sp. Sphag1AF]
MTAMEMVPERGTHTLRYRSSRAEIWRMYWRVWRKKLWVTHVIAAAGAAWLCSNNTLMSMAVWFAVWLPIVVACLAAFPQIMFKSQERMLELTPDGWSSTIGSRSGSMSWKAIRGLADTPEGLVIVSANGNAMVVPQRAFTDVSHRAAVLADVRRWFTASRA